MSHCRGKEEETGFQEITSRETRRFRACVRARWVLQETAFTEQQLGTWCHRVVKCRNCRLYLNSYPDVLLGEGMGVSRPADLTIQGDYC